MAMKIPSSGNPFGVSAEVQSTREMGLVKAPESEFSEAGLAKQLGQAGDKILAAAQKWQEEQDNTRLDDFANQLKSLESDLTYNEETGYARQLGKNALERESGRTLADEVQDRFTEEGRKLMANMSPRVRRRAQELFDATSVTLNNNVNRHVFAQSIEWRKSVTQETLARASAMTQSDDLEERLSGFAIAREATKRRAHDLGLEVDLTVTVGKSHVELLSRMIDEGRLDEAKEWFGQYKHEMSGSQIAGIDKLMTAKETEVTGKALGEKLYLENGSDRAKAYKQLDDVDERYRETAKKGIDAAYQRDEAIRKQENEENEKEAWQFLVNGEAVPLSLEQEIKEKDPKTWRSIETYLRAKEKDTPVVTDLPTWDRLLRMVTANPEAFRSIDFTTYKGTLSETDIKTLQNMQKNLPGKQFDGFMSEVRLRCKIENIQKPEAIQKVEQAAAALFADYQSRSKMNVLDGRVQSDLIERVFKGYDTEWYLPNKSGHEVIGERSVGVRPSNAITSIAYGMTYDEIRNQLQAKGVKTTPTMTSDQLSWGTYYIKNDRWPQQLINDVTRSLEAAKKKGEFPKEIDNKAINTAILKKMEGAR